jgi:hypothetical protein
MLLQVIELCGQAAKTAIERHPHFFNFVENKSATSLATTRGMRKAGSHHSTEQCEPTAARLRSARATQRLGWFLVADVSVHCGQICESKGLVSIDRREITALLSTTPRLKTRSSTNDLAPQHCTVRYFFSHPTPRSAQESDRMLWLRHRGRRNRSARVYRCLRT